jgi:SagB-type dehydrogenase family enzyme
MKRALVIIVSLLVLLPEFLLAGDDLVVLPKPRKLKAVSLERAFNEARTNRAYPKTPLALSELSDVLWAAGGRQSDREDAVSGATRTYPSAGSIYPVQIYVVIGAVTGAKPGIYQYLMADHAMKLLKPGDHREELVKGSSEAGFAARAPATVLLAADFRSSESMFGERGRLLYVPMEAGHVSQNLRLAAAAVGLRVGIAGEFDHSAARTLLGIAEEPLLLLTLGHTP